MTYVLAIVAIAIALGIAASIAFGRRPSKPANADPTASEFAALPEPARCDMIFAAASLEDEDSAKLLQFALDDPSEAVTLAAARGLLGRGLAQSVDDYLQRHPGDRTERISRTLTLISQR